MCGTAESAAARSISAAKSSGRLSPAPPRPAPLDGQAEPADAGLLDQGDEVDRGNPVAFAFRRSLRDPFEKRCPFRCSGAGGGCGGGRPHGVDAQGLVGTHGGGSLCKAGSAGRRATVPTGRLRRVGGDREMCLERTTIGPIRVRRLGGKRVAGADERTLISLR